MFWKISHPREKFGRFRQPSVTDIIMTLHKTCRNAWRTCLYNKYTSSSCTRHPMGVSISHRATQTFCCVTLEVWVSSSIGDAQAISDSIVKGRINCERETISRNIIAPHNRNGKNENRREKQTTAVTTDFCHQSHAKSDQTCVVSSSRRVPVRRGVAEPVTTRKRRNTHEKRLGATRVDGDCHGHGHSRMITNE